MISLPDIKLPWIVTGLQLGVDEVSGVFLLFASLVWIISGVYGFFFMKNMTARPVFFTSYLIAMAGNFGLILAHDIVGFYLFFTVMTFATYVLIVHEWTQKARHAGKVYIVMALIGETLLISAMMLIAPEAESAAFSDVIAAVVASGRRDIFIGLVLSGFGIKTGALLLHMWLPLAYTAAPGAAAAVMSGAMINAGILGWIRFLPFGEIALPGWGALCIGAGIAAAFYGVAMGLVQDNAKTVLAYSSISQMGLMTLVMGVGLAVPLSWPAVLSCLLIYASHHALSKSSLFLGVGLVGGIRRNFFLFAGLLLPSLALAGAPFTSGAVAKVALKAVTEVSHGSWPFWIGRLLPLTAVGTTILMGRFFLLAWGPEKPTEMPASITGASLAWSVLFVCVLTAGFFMPVDGSLLAVRKALSPEYILSASWPVLGGSLLVLTAWLINKRTGISFKFRIPPGDLLELVVATLKVLRSFLTTLIMAVSKGWKTFFTGGLPGRQSGTFVSDSIINAEKQLTRWSIAGAIFLILATILFILLTGGWGKCDYNTGGGAKTYLHIFNTDGSLVSKTEIQ